MIRAALTLMLLLTASLPAPAQDAAAIRGVIEAQIAAFQREDAAGAFAFATPGIRARFGTAEIFMEAVRTGYRPVYRPREVSFAELATVDGAVVQRVNLVGPDGRPVVALYVMEQQADGTWKIAACYLLDSDEKMT